MIVGKIIFSNLPKYKTYINNIIPVRINKLKIELNNYESANNLIMENLLKENKLSSYIYFTTKSGNIRDILDRRIFILYFLLNFQIHFHFLLKTANYAIIKKMKILSLLYYINYERCINFIQSIG